MKKYILLLYLFSTIILYSQSIRLSEYFFASEQTKTKLQFKNHLMEIRYDAIKIVPIREKLYLCQNLEIKKISTQTFTLCTDAGTHYNVFKNGKKISQGKIWLESNSNLIQAKGIFQDNENCRIYLSNKYVAGLNRGVIEFQCDRENYSFAFGLGLFKYNNFILTSIGVR